MNNMQTYVVSIFTRRDEDCEHSSEVYGVFSSEELAIKVAKDIIKTEYSKIYSSKREDSPEGSLKYYCCLDNDPEGEGMFADYSVVTVTEHEMDKPIAPPDCYKISLFEDLDSSFPCIDNHKIVYFTNEDKAIKEFERRFEVAKLYFEESTDNKSQITIEKDKGSFHIFDDTRTIIGSIDKINFEDKER